MQIFELYTAMTFGTEWFGRNTNFFDYIIYIELNKEVYIKNPKRKQTVINLALNYLAKNWYNELSEKTCYFVPFMQLRFQITMVEWFHKNQFNL